MKKAKAICLMCTVVLVTGSFSPTSQGNQTQKPYLSRHDSIAYKMTIFNKKVHIEQLLDEEIAANQHMIDSLSTYAKNTTP